jgi:hypothetical protein
LIFFIFRLSKIHVSPTGVVYSLSPPRCRLSTDRCRHATVPCHTSFPLNQDELAGSALSYDNALSHRIPSRAKTKSFNSHHHNRPPSSDCSTPTLYCYKKIISILVTLPPLNRVSILRPHYPEHHVIGAPPAFIVHFHRCPTYIVPQHNDTHVDELADPISFPE